ncbi:MAG: hypothetical protein JWN45_870 [Acidobacteriaceae bacterium]|nr:hypothetical protein [Acidobacteriaceae bacterium]
MGSEVQSLTMRTFAKIGCACILVSLMLSVAAASNGGKKTTVSKSKVLAPGRWNGEHVTMMVTAKGAELEFDCAAGQIAEPIVLDSPGKFSVAGTFAPEHGGPVQRDEGSSAANARYSGQVSGDSMALTVTAASGGAPIGSFNLTKGTEPSLMKCR